MNKQVLVYFGKEVTERGKKFLINVSKDDLNRLCSQFSKAIIGGAMCKYRLLYKGQIIVCHMCEDKKFIRVFIDDVYHMCEDKKFIRVFIDEFLPSLK